MPETKEPVVFRGYPSERQAELDWLKNRENRESTYMHAIENILADAQKMERTLRAVESMPSSANALEEKMRVRLRDEAHEELVELRDRYEDLINTLPPEHELRKKSAAMEEAAKELFSRMLQKSAEQMEVGRIGQDGPARHGSPEKERSVEPELDRDVYEQRVWAIVQDALQIGEMLKAKGYDPKVRETMLGQLVELELMLRELDAKAEYPDSQVRKDADRVIDELGKRWKELVPPELPPASPMPRPRTPKGSTFAAWMPRVPRPPYADKPDMRVMLAAVSALPPLPTPLPPASRGKPPLPGLPADWAKLGEPERIAWLEGFLASFMAEHSRIMKEHRETLRTIIDRAKARKLRSLRAKLDVSE